MTRQALWNDTRARAIIDSHLQLEGAMLPILHALQEEFGYVDERADALIADSLNLSHAEVRGTISFYHDFHREPAAKHVIQLCRAEACQSVGCEQLVSHLHSAHGVEVDGQTHDGLVQVKTVYCLGNCALGPSALVDGEILGRVDAQTLDALIEQRDHTTSLRDAVEEQRS